MMIVAVLYWSLQCFDDMMFQQQEGHAARKKSCSSAARSPLQHTWPNLE